MPHNGCVQRIHVCVLQVTIAPMKGAELQFAQFVEGLLDAGVQVGGGQYPYPPREKCAIYVQSKGSLEVRIEHPALGSAMLTHRHCLSVGCHTHTPYSSLLPPTSRHLIASRRCDRQCELRVPLESETNGGFVAKKGATPVKLGAKFKILKPSNGTCAYTGHTQCRSACRAATCMTCMSPVLSEMGTVGDCCARAACPSVYRTD